MPVQKMKIQCTWLSRLKTQTTAKAYAANFWFICMELEEQLMVGTASIPRHWKSLALSEDNHQPAYSATQSDSW